MTMLGSLIHDWFGWDSGSVLTNLVATIIWVPLPALWVHRHLKCRDCWYPGTVPVPGSVHKVCKRHAAEHGHNHT